jgi:C4-type Zn-finger protein
VEETVVALEAEVEIVAEAVVEDNKRIRKRRTNLTHMAETKVKEEEGRVSTIFNDIFAKSMVIMQRSVIIMKIKMKRKKKRKEVMVWYY